MAAVRQDSCCLFGASCPPCSIMCEIYVQMTNQGRADGHCRGASSGGEAVESAATPVANHGRGINRRACPHGSIVDGTLRRDSDYPDPRWVMLHRGTRRTSRTTYSSMQDWFLGKVSRSRAGTALPNSCGLLYDTKHSICYFLLGAEASVCLIP